MNKYSDSELPQALLDVDEPYAAGFFEHPERGRFFRLSRAQRTFWEHMLMPEYGGGMLYPSGRKYTQAYAVLPDYSYTFSVRWDILQSKGNPCIEELKKEVELLSTEYTPHTVGGYGYTHSIPNYGRIINEGLDSYEERVQRLESGELREGLLEVLEGIRVYRNRSLAHLKSANAPERLIKALERVPFLPSQDIYEAVVAWNFIYYIDGCDNPGRLDNDLLPFYKGEDIEGLLRELFINVDENNGWSSALGPVCNEITLQCLRAAKGLRRPSLELRVTPETPDDIWEEAQRTLLSGCGQPAFYNEELFQQGLSERFPYIPKEDLMRFNGGGCTETMLAGISNVGSLDAGMNLPLILSEHLRAAQGGYPSFDSFYDVFMEKIYSEVRTTLDILNRFRTKRAAYRPQPVRTLLIDDCIDKGLDFNSGGARYYWSVVNFAGLVNCIDSLLAIKALVFDKKEYSLDEFVRLLDEQDAALLSRLRKCPCYGVDDEEADSLASRFAGEAFKSLDQRSPVLGGAFLPSSIQFVTYIDAGYGVPATPDGRASGEPLADSIGAVHGKDIKGPTSMLNSAAKLPQRLAVGTPVLNIRLSKKVVSEHLKALIMGYFNQGGMQAQISCLSREDIQEAMEYPEKHGNLIVRIGGYSEYFNRLSPELKQSVLKRTEFDSFI